MVARYNIPVPASDNVPNSTAMLRKPLHTIRNNLDTFAQKNMKYIIENGKFLHQVDWGKTEEDGFVEDYRPDLEESIEAFLRLLENIYPQEKIAAYIKKGIEYSAMSPER